MQEVSAPCATVERLWYVQSLFLTIDSATHTEADWGRLCPTGASNQAYRERQEGEGFGTFTLHGKDDPKNGLRSRCSLQDLH
eukprot:scaffold1315_cov405-Prasinococcus_capsulatus_cf.AAC.10